ncbi:RNA polymerase sigma-70 factor (ECF subfamily) [Kineococcus xinjiangensis]|uniref:RNA polymerase sigma-70 factor (ECF subfamily) n=1 Tax=Kineococcus xinjiangensis TaxID=512762 RepID=A0A2S6IVB4_9ACTN|nr:SigE family RNA polymerase sigma factor [Kineococcus xinjiangensis]PPK98093.1 RNA polymerase sigma-70 factor (ECF subfamily) [Kineococcus xinjiangensis]
MGDPADFDDFYAATARRVLGHVFLMTGDLAASEDAVAEAFTRAWERWPAVSASRSPEAWVRTVAARVAVSSWRKARNRLLAHHRQAREPAPVDVLGPDHVALVRALRTLPAKHRQAVVLHHLADVSLADVAEEMDAPVGTVKAWLSRGRAALREQLLEVGTTWHQREAQGHA